LECKFCGSSDCFICWGFYSRLLRFLVKDIRVKIQRYFCKTTNKTFSVLPSFLFPYSWYTTQVIGFCILFYILGNIRSYKRIVKKIHISNKSSFIVFSTVRTWIKKFIIKEKNFANKILKEILTLNSSLNINKINKKDNLPGVTLLLEIEELYQIYHPIKKKILYIERLFEFVNFWFYEKHKCFLL